MAEEERNEAEGQEPEAQAPEEEAAGEEEAQAPETEQPEADPAAPGREAEDAAGNGSADEQEDAAAEAVGEAAEDDLSPKARRKRERSRARGEASPPRTPAERDEERRRRRAARAAARRRARASVRRRRGEPGQGTPRRERLPGVRKVRQGVVTSAKPDKTITVRIEITRRHPTYEKVVRRTSTVHAHDERNQAQEGDVVRVIESRPLSRTKRWRLVEVLERAR
jgi:small subunit ribosomal protein S17